MKTITHEGNEYEVLTYDQVVGDTETMTAVQTASGVVWGVKCGTLDFCVDNESGFWITYKDARDCGFKFLKLLERKPVEFVATFAKEVDGKWYPVYSLDDGLGYQRCEQKQFRCVEVTE